MVSNSQDRELKILKFWEENNIYEKSKSKNKGNKPFNFVDGPPYPTGEAHMGHLRNWAVKDAVFRFKRLQGFDVYARDGYDVHGLPVETKVQNKLGLKTVDELKEFGEENFVAECKKYIAEIIDDMNEVRNRVGLTMNRDFYHTSHPEYLSMAWRFFKKAHEKGLLYKDYKSVAWSPGAETTLSDYEIKDEYAMLEDPSIYVKFQLRKSYTTTGHNESFLIWTTTPWTMQSNMAIAMHPELNYAKVLVEVNGNEEVFIIGEPLVQKVLNKLSKSLDVKFKSVLEVKKGIEFEGTKYDHILLDETPSQQDFIKLDSKFVHSIIMADFVTMGEGENVIDKLAKKSTKHSIGSSEKSSEEISQVDDTGSKEGTGLVHIAPGHGFDDYEVGKKYNLPIFSPVDSKAIITEGQFKGMYFKDADEHIIKYLKEKGVLLHNEKKKHKYPLCWRTKVPIIYRAVEQWWIKRGDITANIIKENSNVKWYPDFAKTSFNNLMENAGDWAISRQRFWGIPLPIFEDEDGNYEVFGSKEELEDRVGVKLDDIHRDDLKNLVIKNEKSGKDMKAVPFIADVWFDSGCASFASHYGEGLTFEQIIDKYYPMTWITESEDQTRGWFSSLFNVGYMVTDKAPYNSVLLYKFVMAKDGQKMSKSLGNGVTGNEALESWGADVNRYYLLTKRPPEDQINFDPDEIPTVESFFNTLQNIFKLVNVYLEEHEVRHPSLNLNSLDIEDQWILYRLNRTLRSYTNNISEMKLNLGFSEVEDFIVRDLSKTYLKLIKDRLDERDENLIIVLNEVLKKSLLMLAPSIPFLTEDIYLSTSFMIKKESLFLEDMPEADGLLLKEIEKLEIEENFELAQDVIQSILNSREKAKIGVRWPLGRADILSSSNLEPKLKPFEQFIKKLTNIQKLSYELSDDVQIEFEIKPNFKTLKEDFDDVQSAIKVINTNKFYISDDLKEGKSSNIYDNLEIDYEKHIIKSMEVKGEVVSSDFSKGNVVLETAQDEILLEEGYIRELIRRVQDVRKEMGLNKKDEVSLSFSDSDEYYLDLIQNWESLIKKRVGATEVLSEELDNKQEFEIKDRKLVVSIKIN